MRLTVRGIGLRRIRARIGVVCLDTINPTAENIAAYLFRGVSRILGDGQRRVSAITLWETERACVRYQENNTL